MTRENMLEQLHKTEFCAVPTVQTIDMGIEFDFVDNCGAGTALDSIGSWPLFRLANIEASKLAVIKRKIVEKTLDLQDIAGTDLQFIYESCPNYKLVMLCDLQDIKTEYFWCFCDTYSFNPETKFFKTKEKMADYFHCCKPDINSAFLKKEECINVIFYLAA